MHKRILLLLLITCCHLPLAAQHGIWKWLHSETDTTYISDHTEDITFRLYGSRKYTSYDIRDTRTKKHILYRPNTPFNIGVGFNYKFIGLNLGFNFPFINRHNDKYGQTKYLDLQSHIYLRKLVVDFYGQYYKGYYIANPAEVFSERYNARHPYPQRPDIYNVDAGLNVQYIFNDKKFSYRAPNVQNEYQKKSAGSFMVGGEVFFVKIKGDSSLIPTRTNDSVFLHDKHFVRTGISSLAANVGYAYTFVIKKHFFLSLSVTAALGANRTKLYLVHGPIDRHIGWQINNTVRASFGYNSNKYFAGIHYVGMANRSEMSLPHTFQTFGTGNFRVSLVRRFGLKKQFF